MSSEPCALTGTEKKAFLKTTLNAGHATKHWRGEAQQILENKLPSGVLCMNPDLLQTCWLQPVNAFPHWGSTGTVAPNWGWAEPKQSENRRESSAAFTQCSAAGEERSQGGETNLQTNNRKRIHLPKQRIHLLQCRNVNPSLLISVSLPWHFLSFPVILTEHSLSVILFILIKKSVMRTKSHESNVDSKLKRNSHGQIFSVLCQHD